MSALSLSLALPLSAEGARYLPGGGLAGSAIHELRGPANTAAHIAFAVLLLAGLPSAVPILWVSFSTPVYPPGLARLGLDPARCLFAQAGNDAECLGTLETALRGGMAGVAEPAGLSRLAARRLALAAKKGNSIGILLRHAPAFTAIDSTAPATRWLISPIPGATLPGGAPEQGARLRAELLYARGGRPGVFSYEVNKEADDAHTPPALALVTEWPDLSGTGHKFRRTG